MEHFNQLTPAEAERLALLSEECGEVIQAIGKILRHGFESAHPDGGPTNRASLERECGDVYLSIRMLINAGDMDGDSISRRAEDKAESVNRYLHHQHTPLSKDTFYSPDKGRGEIPTLTQMRSILSGKDET